MELTPNAAGGWLEVKVVGRLDAHWADHLGRAVDEYIRQGHDRVYLDLATLDYVSSVGLRTLVTAWKKFTAMQGSFGLCNPTANVRQVIEMAGLARLLAELPSAGAPATAEPVARKLEGPGFTGEVYALGTGHMRLSVHGRTDWAEGRPYCAEELRERPLLRDQIVIGLGALGPDYDACRSRFGEYLGVAGALSYQPGDGSNTCDTLVGHGTYAPAVQSLHGVCCEGNFTTLLRFEFATGQEHIPLSGLMREVLALNDGAPTCVVIAAESAGLIGASLRRSPATIAEGEKAFEFPALRDWISFTSEASWQRMSTVVVGVVARDGEVPAALQSFLRPLGAENEVAAHLHAAVFGFHPLPRGAIDLESVLRPWFEHDTVEAVLHLLADDRETGLLRESVFTRGACWLAPLTFDGTVS